MATAPPLAQAPAWQLSPAVQASPSLHALPFGFAGFEQLPVAGSQVPTSWHWSDAAQVRAMPGLHAPAPSQVSAPLQAFPSEHDDPAGVGMCTTPPTGSQASAVHGLPSSTATGAPAAHVPDWQ